MPLSRIPALALIVTALLTLAPACNRTDSSRDRNASTSGGKSAQVTSTAPEDESRNDLAPAESVNPQVGAEPSESTSTAQVQLIRTPDGGLQPQAAIDGSGALHLVYFKGDPLRGDLFYVRREAEGADFSAPIRVNSQPGSAVAVGTIRGAQIAVGRAGRVHVAWNGSSKAEPRGASNEAPMLYSRLDDSGTAFEPQRNVCQFAYGLDGGGSVAADEAGNVYVTWHSMSGARDESERRVWVAASHDDGASFERERPAYEEPTGACGCCGMRALADRQGTLYLLYRAATESVHRDMILLTQAESASRVSGTTVGPWEVNACPMSSASFAEGPERVWAAWETEQRVFFTSIDPATFEIAPAISPTEGRASCKHPSLAAGSQGEVLLAWVEGTGWEKGGTLAWQIYDADGRPTQSAGRADGVPVWSFASAVALPSGDFLVVY